jgi:hypothetical protein
MTKPLPRRGKRLFRDIAHLWDVDVIGFRSRWLQVSVNDPDSSHVVCVAFFGNMSQVFT